MGLFKLKCHWEKILKSSGAYTVFEFAIFKYERGARSCVIYFLKIITAPGGDFSIDYQINLWYNIIVPQTYIVREACRKNVFDHIWGQMNSFLMEVLPTASDIATTISFFIMILSKICIDLSTNNVCFFKLLFSNWLVSCFFVFHDYMNPWMTWLA